LQEQEADLIQGDDTADATSEVGEASSTSEATTKAVVPPPKFVFGSESVKSILVVKNQNHLHLATVQPLGLCLDLVLMHL